jgi:hypothetical protein
MLENERELCIDELWDCDGRFTAGAAEHAEIPLLEFSAGPAFSAVSTSWELLKASLDPGEIEKHCRER